MDEDLLVPPLPVATAKKAIETRFPEIRVEAITYLGGGSHSAFAVNDEFVFRFPKLVENVASVDEMQELFAAEKLLLSAIQQAVFPFETPTQILLYPEPLSDFPAPVAGYPLLKGEQVANLLRQNTADASITNASVTDASTPLLLGAFLNKLHAITPEQLPLSHRGRPTVQELQASWLKHYQHIQTQLFPYLDADERAWTTTTFELFLQDADKHKPSIVFNHGDFGAENVLYDSASRAVSVIDFDDAGFGDSVGDFCLWLDYGEAFVQEMRCGYAQPTDAHFMERAHFYYNRIPYIYFDLGRKTGNREFIEFGRALLSARMRRG